jgi:serine phosphatase RsbU (regulator of sigma subunit)
MTEHYDFTKFSQRLANLASRFEEKAKSKSREPAGRGPKNFLEDIISNLRDLFTRDVTPEGLREMLHHDAHDTFRFFTREVDFEALSPLPRYKRYPRMIWEVFKALAYRLNPPRRIAFALAMFAFLLGLLQFLSFSVRVDNGGMRVQGHSGGGLWLIAIVILVFLLLLELRDKLDLKADLNIAREIQFGLVPSAPFQENQVQIHCQMRPANTVGGDYYDIIELEAAKRVAVVVGDVAGKGMPAALLMALLQGSLRTLITAGFRGSTLVSRLNDYLCVSTPQNSLVTLFYGELDTIEGRLSYVNAGHNGPFLSRQTRELERLDSTSMVLGIMNNPPFESKEAQLHPGDRLILFTDGISETFNGKNEEYGEKRLADFIQQNREMNAPLFIQTLFSEVLRFCGSVKPTDDMTLMIIERQN